jgi:hypothetical protein
MAKVSLETDLFDTVYGKLLSKNISPISAKTLAKTLVAISKEAKISTDDLLKNITVNGIRFDVNIYKALNNVRSNSSQIGYIDIGNISPVIKSQII